MSKKSEHKQAVQTAQRALQAARNAEVLARASTPHRSLWKRLGLGAIASFIIAVIGLAGSHWPRVDIDLLDSHFNPDRPFPDSIKITNSGGSELSYVSVKMRICSAKTGDLKGTIVGRTGQSCAGPTGRGGGGFDMSAWANHKLQRGESWPLPVAADPRFAVTFNVGQADVSAYVEYWPSILPSFYPVFSTERRFTTGTDRDGKPIWRAIPLD